MNAQEDSANTDRQQTFGRSIEDLQQILEVEDPQQTLEIGDLQQTLEICTLYKDSATLKLLKDENFTKGEHQISANI